MIGNIFDCVKPESEIPINQNPVRERLRAWMATAFPPNQVPPPVDGRAPVELWGAEMTAYLDTLMPKRVAMTARPDDRKPVRRGELRKAMRTIRRALQKQDDTTAETLSAILNRSGGVR